MSLRIRFRFDGRCSAHPRYNPETDGRPQHQDCPGCDTLWVASLYCGIARRKAEAGKGILVSHPEIHGKKMIPPMEKTRAAPAKKKDTPSPV
jgi:hypothetical protein